MLGRSCLARARQVQSTAFRPHSAPVRTALSCFADLRARRVSEVGFMRLMSTGNDFWAPGSQRRVEDAEKRAARAVLLVERVSSVSDIAIGEPMRRMPAGGLEDWATPVSAEESIRLTLFDKAFFDLEAPYLENKDSLATSAGLEEAFLSPAVMQAYHRTKPHLVGAVGLDITQTRVFLQGGSDHRPDAPFVTILEHTKNIAGESVLKLRLLNSAERGRQAEIFRRPSKVLTGSPVTSELYAASPADKVKACLRWVWPHGHIADVDIQLKRCDGSGVDDDDLNGRLLLVSNAREPAVTFAFSNNTFVPSDVVVTMQGLTVQVLVNVKDVSSAAGPAPAPPSRAPPAAVTEQPGGEEVLVNVKPDVKDVPSAAGPAGERSGEDRDAPEGQLMYYLVAAVAGSGLIAMYLLHSDQDAQLPDTNTEAAQIDTELQPSPSQQLPPKPSYNAYAVEPSSDAKTVAAIRPLHYALVLGAVSFVACALYIGFGAAPSAAVGDAAADASTSTVQCA